MELEKGTKAYKAYHAGLIAKDIKDNPYLMGKYAALSNWWVKGFNDAEAERLAKSSIDIV